MAPYFQTKSHIGYTNKYLLYPSDQLILAVVTFYNIVPLQCKHVDKLGIARARSHIRRCAIKETS